MLCPTTRQTPALPSGGLECTSHSLTQQFSALSITVVVFGAITALGSFIFFGFLGSFSDTIGSYYLYCSGSRHSTQCSFDSYTYYRPFSTSAYYFCYPTQPSAQIISSYSDDTNLWAITAWANGLFCIGAVAAAVAAVCHASALIDTLTAMGPQGGTVQQRPSAQFCNLTPQTLNTLTPSFMGGVPSSHKTS